MLMFVHLIMYYYILSHQKTFRQSLLFEFDFLFIYLLILNYSYDMPLLIKAHPYTGFKL